MKTRIQSQIVKMKASADALTGPSSRSILGLFWVAALQLGRSRIERGA